MYFFYLQLWYAITEEGNDIILWYWLPFLVGHWELFFGTFEEEALQASLNVTVYATVYSSVGSLYFQKTCQRDHGDLINLFWWCPKPHIYWVGMGHTLSMVFHTSIQLVPKQYVLSILKALQLQTLQRHKLHPSPPFQDSDLPYLDRQIAFQCLCWRSVAAGGHRVAGTRQSAFSVCIWAR